MNRRDESLRLIDELRRQLADDQPDISLVKRDLSRLEEMLIADKKNNRNLQDINQQIHATKQQLRASEESTRKLVETIPDIVTRFDRQARYLYASPNIAGLIGIEASDCIGKCNSELGFTQEEGRFFDSTILRVFETEKPIETELSLKGKEDNHIINWRLMPERDSVGEVVSVITIARDITEHRRAERELVREQNLFQQLMNSVPDRIYFKDLEGRFIRSNKSHREWLHLKDKCEYLGKTDRDIFSEEHALKAFSDERRVIETGAPILNIEERETWPDRDDTWALTSKMPLRDERGKIIGTFGISRDITEMRETQAEHERLLSELHQSQKMESIGRLAGGVAHDFNNMLMGIMGYTEMCREAVEDDNPMSEWLEQIYKGAERSADLTRQLLAFARKQTILPVEIDINNSIKTMLKILRPLIGENISLEWRPGYKICPVLMDPSQLDQILTNLCINARDAIEGNGNILIASRDLMIGPDESDFHPEARPGHFVKLSVSDNGTGMEQDDLKQIFDPFFTTKGVGEGTGLGLSTVYGIVKQNKGFITVDSNPGQGTQFDIYFPCMREGISKEKCGKKEPETISESGETVLLVEDDPSILKIATQILKNLGYAVLPFNKPIEALDRARDKSKKIDILVTDVVMPNMNGGELAGLVRAEFPDIKVLFMSGYAADVLSQDTETDSNSAFLQKPFTKSQMASLLAEMRS